MKASGPAITRKARRLLLHACIKLVEVPLIVASATTWWLEGVRIRLRTTLALIEEEGRR